MNTTKTSFTSTDSFVHIGVDLAKNVFQVAYKAPTSSKFVNRQLKRKDFKEFLENANSFKKHIFVEACGSSYYWCRLAIALGHKATIIPATATATFVQNNKSDVNDAKAIWQLSFVPDVKTVRIRSEANQILGTLLKLREKLINERTKLCNWIRGQLYELGFVTSLGDSSKITKLLDDCSEQTKEKEWSDIFSTVSNVFKDSLKAIEKNIKTTEDYIISYARKDNLCCRLMTIPYIGPVNSVAISYVMEDSSCFKNGRQFASYVGLSPKHTGTGGEIRILGVGEQGHNILKRTIYQSALSMYCRYKERQEQIHDSTIYKDLAEYKEKLTEKAENSSWIAQLSRRMPCKKAVCAIANKMVRTAWAVAASNGGYNYKLSTLVKNTEENLSK